QAAHAARRLAPPALPVALQPHPPLPAARRPPGDAGAADPGAADPRSAAALWPCLGHPHHDLCQLDRVVGQSDRAVGVVCAVLLALRGARWRAGSAAGLAEPALPAGAGLSGGRAVAAAGAAGRWGDPAALGGGALWSALPGPPGDPGHHAGGAGYPADLWLLLPQPPAVQEDPPCSRFPH